MHGALRELLRAQGVRVSTLDLLAHRIQRRDVRVRTKFLHGVHRPGRGLLHRGLIRLGPQLVDLRELLLEAELRFLLLALGLLCVLRGLGVQLLRLLELLLHGHELGGEDFGGVVVLLRLGRVAVGDSLVRGLDGGARLILVLLLGLEETVELHLQLLLVADDGRGLLGDLLVLALRGVGRLLDLHLGVRILVDLGVEGRHQVLPALAERVSHGVGLAF